MNPAAFSAMFTVLFVPIVFTLSDSVPAFASVTVNVAVASFQLPWSAALMATSHVPAPTSVNAPVVPFTGALDRFTM